jgi:hypothetical protein
MLESPTPQAQGLLIPTHRPLPGSSHEGQNSSQASTTRPPKTRLTFRIGVVGHRPNRLQDADLGMLQHRIHALLMLIRDRVTAFGDGNASLFAPGCATLRVVSPLAEGADRIVAEAALGLGYQLHCPMPFAQAEFEKDFEPPEALEPDSLTRFHDLLECAERSTGLVKFELDGSRKNAPAAYGAAGRVVLNQSDVLIVIWDGKEAAGAGGTVQTLHEAIFYQVPVLWIDAVAPHVWQLLRTGEQLACLDPGGAGRCVPKQADGQELEALIEESLRPPDPEDVSAGHGKPKRDLREAFFGERKPTWNVAFVWKFLRDAVGSNRFRLQLFKIEDFENAVANDWPDDAPGVAGRVNRQLRKHYAWADKLADLYADRYRSAFVSAYLLSVLSVFLALLCMAAGWRTHAREVFCTLAELAVIAVIFGLIAWGRSRRWHERWIDYRLVAELVRQLRFLVPLGGGRPFPRFSPHLATFGNPARTWMYWHVRAIERETGLSSAQVTLDYLKSCLRYLGDVVEEQIRFHQTSQKRLGRIDHRLHLAGLILFGLTGLACFLHSLLHGELLRLPRIELPPWLSPGWLTLLCAVLPALGAALAGINNQGEFLRISKRSRAMAQRLAQVKGEIEALLESPSDPTFGQVLAIASTVAQLMVDEVLDWRVLFQDRPPVLPA